MNQQELSILLAADAVESVDLQGMDLGHGLVWSAYVLRSGVAAVDTAVLGARGEVKEWRSMNTAFFWLRRLGWNGPVMLRGARLV